MAISNTIITIKRSAATGNVPAAGTLANGELAINFADEKLFFKNSAGVVKYFHGANSFSTVSANGGILLATSELDTLTITPGNNCTISTDTVLKKIIINGPTSSNLVMFNGMDKKNYIAAAAQTVFALTYTPSWVIVTINGIVIDPSEYIANNGSFIYLTTSTSAGDVIDLTGFVQSNVTIFNIPLSTSCTQISVSNVTGAWTITGGVGIAGNLYASNVYVVNTYPSFSTTSGALQVSGGAGIAGNVYIGGELYATGNIIISGQASTIGGSLTVGAGIGTTFLIASLGQPSTSTTSGSLQVSGGAGIKGNVYAGNVYVVNAFPSLIPAPPDT